MVISDKLKVLYNRMKAQSKEKPTVIATGGMANLIAEESTVIDIVDPLFNVKRIAFNLYKRNQ